MSQPQHSALSAALKTQATPGGVAGVFDANGTLALQAFGTRSTDDPTPMSVDNVFAIMSMTKPITGAAAMQLVEQERLALDEDAGKVCPWLGEVQVLTGFDDNGEPRLRSPRSAITLRHLLTHTSGFVYNTWNSDMVRYMQHCGTPEMATLQKAALRVPILFDPGSRWEYGLGIDWVGQMIEAVSGQTLGEYLAEHLTGPLGMIDTAFSATPSMSARRVPIHLRQTSGELKPLPPLEVPNPEFEMGGGGLLSTAVDFGKFMQMILRGGELNGQRVLKAETVATMSQNHIAPLTVRPLASTAPVLSADAEFFPGAPKGWGLTFQTSEAACDTGRSRGTLMWAGLANTFFWIDPQAQLAGVYLTQLFPFVDPQVLSTYYAYETAAYAAFGKGQP